MDQNHICPNCHADTTAAIATEAQVCPTCGWKLDAERRGKPAGRSGSWVVFWISFLGTPAIALLSLTLGMRTATLQVILGVLITGSLISGMALAAIKRRKEGKYFVLGIALAMGIFMVYLGVAFVGCLVALSNTRM